MIASFTQGMWYTVRKHTMLMAKLAVFLVFVAFMIYHRKLAQLSDPVIDLLVYLGIGALTAFLASLAGHVATDKRRYLLMFYIGGVLLFALVATAGIRNYRATIAAQKTAKSGSGSVSKIFLLTSKTLLPYLRHA